MVETAEKKKQKRGNWKMEITTRSEKDSFNWKLAPAWWCGSLHASLKKLSDEYGPLVFLKLGSIPTLVVSSQDMAKEFLQTHDLVIPYRPMFYAPTKISYGGSDIAFARCSEYWRQYEAEKGYEAEHNNLHMMLLETQNLLAGFNTADLFPWMSWIHKFDGLDTRLEKNFTQADKFYEKVIDEHINNNNKSSKTGVEDFVDVLLRTQKDPGYSVTLTKDRIKAILMVCFSYVFVRLMAWFFNKLSSFLTCSPN
ncbi:hypothetical protein MKX03_033521 [Papaver bracteatum]|nr:hypothetical protein MKX03_033521 [Papaver bracteatum]